MSDFLKDVRYGVRMLRKRPGTSALAVAALALGIGLTATMFGIVDAAFLRGLPFERPRDIVAVSRAGLSKGGNGSVPLHDFVDWRAGQHAFEDLSAVSTFPANIASPGEAPERYSGAYLTTNTLTLLRTRPALGRDFTNADAAPGGAPVVLISDVIFSNRYRRAPDVINQTVRINGEVATIVGVMPPRFGYPNSQDLWMPMKLTLAPKRGEGRSVDVVGRLKPGVTAASAQAEMKAIAAHLAEQYPENKTYTATVLPYMRRFLGQQVISTLSAMLVAVFGVLLIACVNVTNLQLARAAERTKEMAVRVALGASRLRLVRQLLVEGLLLACGGAALGLGIAYVGTALFARAIVDTNPPFWIVVGLDLRVVAFVTLLTVVAALASSLVPALRVARQSVNEVLKDEGRSNTGLRMGRFSRSLVVVEMMLSFILLVVSGLMIKSVVVANTLHYPFATDLLVARTNLNDTDYKDDAQVRQVTDRLRARIAAAPGVRNVAMATSTPAGGGTFNLQIEGDPVPAVDAPKPQARRIDVSPEFFDVVHVPIVRGRGLAAADREGGLPVAVVGDDFVRKYFPRTDPLGRRFQIGADPKQPVTQTWWTIVGVVPSLAVAPQAGDTNETVYVPLAQAPNRGLMVLASSSGAPLSVTASVRSAAVDVDPNLPIFQINSLQGQFDRSNWPVRVFGSLFMTFGLAALLMAAAGLYGVMSFGVRRRTQEIGVRMALGADRPRIIRMVVQQGVWQVGLGIVVGLGIGGWLATQMKELLFRVQPWDPTVFAATIVVLGLTGFIASLVPAMRAASVDPLVALRRD